MAGTLRASSPVRVSRISRILASGFNRGKLVHSERRILNDINQVRC